MTKIFYETFPVVQMTFEGEWRLEYDPSWEARRSAFPISFIGSGRSAIVTKRPGAVADRSLVLRKP
ncbi:hypothetical protein AJ87_33670 [Rhizobium yanglingense]|nr:hypothetical protein AJ87_33670 [Rhizobium yanglingense]